MKKVVSKIGTLAFLLSTLFICTACPDDHEKDEVKVDRTSLSFEAKGGQQSILVTSNTNWMVGGTNEWCTVTPSTGNGNSSITINVTSNNMSSDRSNTLTIMAGDATTTITISQAAPQFSVTPTEITLLSNEGSYSAISITTTSKWTASTSAKWLHLSSTSGEGYTMVTVTALSDNTSAEEREATVNILMEGGMSQSVRVSQRAKYISAYVDIDNILALTNSVAFRQSYRGDVSYYYIAYLSKSSSAGWTDDKVVSTITKQFDADKPSDDGEPEVYFIDELTANSSYYLYTVAYNEKGEQGPLQRYEVNTPRAINNRPRVTYGNISYDTNYWYWSTTIGPYAKRYYMVAYDDEMAYIFMAYYGDALIAYLMKEDIDSGDITPIVNSGNWNMRRTTDAIYFYSAAWAQDDDGKMAGELDYRGGQISSARSMAPMERRGKANMGHVSEKKLKKDAEHMKVFVME